MVGMESLGVGLAALLVALLVLAACADIATRTIPDRIAVAVAIIGIAIRALTGPAALAVSAAAALVLLLILLPVHARGILGGGDVKLFAVTCLGLPLLAIQRFLVVTVMAGGLLALLHLAARWALRDLPNRKPPPRGTALPRRVLVAERWRIARRGPLPYGVAIACGGIWAIVHAAGT